MNNFLNAISSNINKDIVNIKAPIELTKIIFIGDLPAVLKVFKLPS